MNNKYDTQISIEGNSSLSYIIKNIKEESTVLEFGPATGYMTKYLKEVLRCKVYVVEVDQEAYDCAIEYAEDGICCNAEEFEWIIKFQHIKFDYITFADVLEHLVYPEKVLAECKRNLKEQGKILISLPNIAHNAVLIDLFNNKFLYRKTGILDNTHLRFYTHESARELFNKLNYVIEDEDAVVFDYNYVGFNNSEKDVSENIANELMYRKYGYVNQFLFRLADNKTKELPINKVFYRDIHCLQGALYYSTDDFFVEERKHNINIMVDGNKFFAEYVGKIGDNTKKIRIDLFWFYCAVSNIKIESNIEMKLEGMEKQEELLFIESYPQIFLSGINISELTRVRISGEFRMLIRKDYLEELSKSKNIQNELILKLKEANEIIASKCNQQNI